MTKQTVFFNVRKQKPIHYGLIWFSVIIVVVFVPAIHVFAQKPILSTGIIPDGFGYNIHFIDAKAGEMEMLADAGATVIRTDFSWGGLEREKGVYDFSGHDRLTLSMEKQKKKIRPMYVISYRNKHYDQGLSPHTPEGPAAFVRWVSAAVTHFKGRRILWKMYNEPNLQRFWTPKPNPEKYVQLALEVGRAIRSIAPNEIYVGPATSGIDFSFLESCFKAGLLEYWDAVTVHPYRPAMPETYCGNDSKRAIVVQKSLGCSLV